MSNFELTKNMTELVSLARQAQVENVTDTQIVTYIASHIIGFDSALPSQSVSHPVESWYIENCLASVEAQLEKLNESYVLDIDTCTRMIRSIWRMRYNMVHQPASDEALRLIDMLHTNEDNDNVPASMSEMFNRIKYKSAAPFNYYTSKVKEIIKKQMHIIRGGS